MGTLWGPYENPMGTRWESYENPVGAHGNQRGGRRAAHVTAGVPWERRNMPASIALCLRTLQQPAIFLSRRARMSHTKPARTGVATTTDTACTTAPVYTPMIMHVTEPRAPQRAAHACTIALLCVSSVPTGAQISKIAGRANVSNSMCKLFVIIDFCGPGYGALSLADNARVHRAASVHLPACEHHNVWDHSSCRGSICMHHSAREHHSAWGRAERRQHQEYAQEEQHQKAKGKQRWGRKLRGRGFFFFQEQRQVVFQHGPSSLAYCPALLACK